MRLFVAIELPREVRGRLEALLEELRPMPLRVGWVRPEGVHLTLKFLGEVAPGRLDRVTEALHATETDLAPLRLAAGGVGTFPERGVPRVLWAGVTGEIGQLMTLQKAIDRTLERIGFAPESRAFHPHLTLGRVKEAGRGDWRSFLDRHAETSLGSFEAREFVLFESRLAPTGATYHALRRFSLPGGGAS